MRWILALPLILVLLSGCNNKGSWIDDGFLAGVKLSASGSSLAVSTNTIMAGQSLSVELSIKDESGNAYYVPNSSPVVVLTTSGGTSQGTFDTVVNHRNGTYTANFTGTVSGSATHLVATIDGLSIESSPAIVVTPGSFSLSHSVVTLSSSTVASGSSITATLHTYDTSNNPLTSGGFAVSFTRSGGVSTGTFSAVTDNGDGTYSATFTGAVAGSATSIGATIGGQALTSALPTVAVTNGSATQMVFSTQPTGGVAQGVNLPTQPVLVIQDANGNTVTSGVDATANVTLSLSSGTGALTGTTTVAASGGIATFSGISVDTQGAGKVITATKANTFFSGGTTSKTVTSNSFTMNPPPPGAFTISSAVAGSSQVVLTWGASSDVSTYTVKYGTSTGTYGTTFSSSATSPTTVTGLTPGTTYYFMVTANNVTGSTNATSEASATPLSSFSITSATVTTGGAVQLIWGASTGSTSYTVKYGTSSGTYGTTASTSATSPYDVTGLTGGTTYYFMVTAVNSSGSVNATVEVSATAISAFSIASIAPAVLSEVVTWGTVSGSTSYDVLYDTTSHAGSGSYASSSTGASSPSVISSLVAGTVYYYRVRANNANGSVLSSNELSGQVYQSFVMDLPFTAGSEASYTISDLTRVDLTGGVVRLTPAAQTDNAMTSTGVSGGFYGATMVGAQWDNTNGIVRLNTTTNNAELDASWTPQWSSLVGYWKLNGAVGAISNGATVAATVGANGSANYSAGTGMAFLSGQMNQGINFDGNDSVSVPAATAPNPGSNITVAFWMKGLSTSQPDSWTSLVQKDPESSGLSGWIISRNNATQKLWLQVDTTAVFNQAVSSNAVVFDGIWHHVICTLTSSGAASIYIDGKYDAGFTYGVGGGFANSSANLVFGAHNAGHHLYNGVLDDISIWSTTLSASEIQTIYARQSARYSGLATSRVMDAYSTQSWTTISPTTTLPFYKELPGSSGSESSTGYSSQTASLMSGIVGLWHLDEAVGTNGTNSISESSGNSNSGTPVGGVTLSTFGKFGNAASFDGSTGYIKSKQAVVFTQNQMTISAWVFKNQNGSGGRFVDYNDGSTLDSVGDSTATLRTCIYLPVSTWTCPNSNSALPVGRWVQAVSVYDGSSGTIKIFIDGKLDRTVSGVANEIPVSSVVNLGAKIMSGGVYDPWNGSIDEVAIWNRALSSAEVLELYRRGANRLKYQIRSCANNDCSDQEALTSSGKGWKGPDNTQLSYFSELYNTTNNVLGGTVAVGAPTMSFSNFSGSGLSVTNNRYFQYRAVLESDDQNSLCTYGGSAANCSPELQSVVVGPDHFDTTVQSIISKVSIGSAYQTIDTNGFTETGGSCSAGLKYALSSDGTTFYYWNGSAWAVSSAYATASDAATVRSNISSFPASAAGTGTLQIKTYLKSDGQSACQVDNLQVTGRSY